MILLKVFYLSSEINQASQLDLNEFKKFKDLLRLIRAKLFREMMDVAL